MPTLPPDVSRTFSDGVSLLSPCPIIKLFHEFLNNIDKYVKKIKMAKTEGQKPGAGAPVRPPEIMTSRIRIGGAV